MTLCRCKDDLDQIQKSAAKEISAQTSDKFDVRIMVHMGTCGLAAGAQEAMDALQEEVAKQDDVSVQIIPCGCAGMCSSEPNVTVERRGEQPIMYKHMDADTMRQVFKRHVLRGEVQTDFALAKLQDLNGE